MLRRARRWLVWWLLAACSWGVPAVLLAQSGNDNQIADLLRLDLDQGATKPFLEAEQAFVARAEVMADGSIAVHWDIADGYYLYRQRLRFTIDGQTTAITFVELPAGDLKNDPYFGPMEVYHQRFAARIVLQQPLTVAPPRLLGVVYQGCAEAGLCYPPVNQQFTLSLPTVPVSGTHRTLTMVGGDTTAENALSKSDRLTLLLRESNLLAITLSFLGFGLLLAFTPCMLPMVPILSSIIIGQENRPSTNKAFFLSAVFVLTMAITYTVAGILAATFGANLSAVLQKPLILAVVAGLLVMLALSLFSHRYISLPSTWQDRLNSFRNRCRGGSWLGVSMMGLLSALIISPCVSVPFAAALIVIGQTGDPVLGGVALFSLGMGMGIPLLLISTAAGRFLPRSGRWMMVIENIFGVLLLAVAIIILERIIPGPVVLLLWALLLIIVAIYMGALETIASGSSHWRRLSKGSSLAMLVYSIILMVGASMGAHNPLRPLQSLERASVPASDKWVQFRSVKGVSQMQLALQQAVVGERPTMLKYYADWCVSCKQIERDTLANAAVQQELQALALLQTDVTANDSQDRALLKHYGVYGPPAMLFFDAVGKELRQHRVIGYVPAAQFLQIIHQVLKSREKIVPLKAAQVAL